MTIESAREVMRRLQTIKDKIKSLPDDMRGDLMLDCMLIEDKVRDKFFRSKKVVFNTRR